MSYYFHNEPTAIAFSEYPKSGIYWESPVLSDSLKVIGAELCLKDISQGSIMNDYFVTAVSAICARSDLLKQNFVSGESKKVEFSLNLQGKWQKVSVDLKLPFYLKAFDDPDNPKKKQFKIKHLGCPNQNHVLWLSYLEKCYAKAMEGYFNICLRGEPAHALTDLTGAPTKIIYLSHYGSDKIFDW